MLLQLFSSFFPIHSLTTSERVRERGKRIFRIVTKETHQYGCFRACLMLNDCCTSYTDGERKQHSKNLLTADTFSVCFKAFPSARISRSLRNGKSWISDAYWRWILIKFQEQCIADISAWVKRILEAKSREIDLIYDDFLHHHHHQPNEKPFCVHLWKIFNFLSFIILFLFHCHRLVIIIVQSESKRKRKNFFFPSNLIWLWFMKIRFSSIWKKVDSSFGFDKKGGKINFNPQLNEELKENENLL